MAAACPQPSRDPKAAAAWGKVLDIKEDVDALIVKMQKKPNFSPNRKDLEKYAEKLIKFINKNHHLIASYERYLKAAIIDLSECPEMAPEMQRLSYLTSLKDASKNLQEFMNC